MEHKRSKHFMMNGNVASAAPKEEKKERKTVVDKKYCLEMTRKLTNYISFTIVQLTFGTPIFDILLVSTDKSI